MKEEKTLVIGLPRGGVPVAFEVARALEAPMDVLVVRKIGAPENPEFGVGAVSEDGVPWLNMNTLAALGISVEALGPIIKRETEEAKRRVRLFRGNRPRLEISGRTVLLVDDGIATGVTAVAAARCLKRMGARKTVLCVPVCAAETVGFIRNEVDEIVCLEQIVDFGAVGFWYEDFSQISDEEVAELLSKSLSDSLLDSLSASTTRKEPESATWPRHSEIRIVTDGVSLAGTFSLPKDAKGLVIFAHGSGSSRLSPRNIQVATTLNQTGFATLLFDLLSEEESLERANVFDVQLLSDRLILATKWAREKMPSAKGLPIGYFGASTGAAAALWAASKLGDEIAAVVSRGGRPDLASERLAHVSCPVLLIVGGFDEPVIELNESALKMLPSAELKVVPGATHLFEEPGALEAVARHATAWFAGYLKTKVSEAKAA